jgi:hypothetical protein
VEVKRLNELDKDERISGVWTKNGKVLCLFVFFFYLLLLLLFAGASLTLALSLLYVPSVDNNEESMNNETNRSQ